MTISLDVNPTQRNLDALKAFVAVLQGEDTTPAEVQEAPRPATEKAKPVKQTEAPKPEAPKPVEIDADQVRAVAKEVRENGATPDQIRSVLSSFGAASVTALSAEHYADAITELKKLAA
jgi:hypothetical protein